MKKRTNQFSAIRETKAGPTCAYPGCGKLETNHRHILFSGHRPMWTLECHEFYTEPAAPVSPPKGICDSHHWRSFPHVKTETCENWRPEVVPMLPAPVGHVVGQGGKRWCGETHALYSDAAPVSPPQQLTDKSPLCVHNLLPEWCRECSGVALWERLEQEVADGKIGWRGAVMNAFKAGAESQPVSATPEPPTASQFWFDGSVCKQHKVGCCLDCMKAAARAEAWKSVCDAAAQSLSVKAPTVLEQAVRELTEINGKLESRSAKTPDSELLWVAKHLRR